LEPEVNFSGHVERRIGRHGVVRSYRTTASLACRRKRREAPGGLCGRPARGRRYAQEQRVLGGRRRWCSRAPRKVSLRQHILTGPARSESATCRATTAERTGPETQPANWPGRISAGPTCQEIAVLSLTRAGPCISRVQSGNGAGSSGSRR
jgi:hypothetical protein